jgi:long-chain fatty acid transport protein
MKHRDLIVKAALLLLVCVPASATAAGFGIFTQSASSLGQAAAVVAHGDDPSVIFFNPALLNKLEGTQLQVGTTLLFPSRTFTNTSGQRSDTKDEVFYPSTAYVSHKFSDRISVGLGVFSPFGLGTDWGDTWEGRYLASNSEMISLTVNPVVSVQVTPQLALAVGLDILYLDTTLERMLFLGSDVRQKFSGDGTGIGFNVGAVYDITPQLALGVSYRSEIEVGVRGDFQIQGLMSTGGKADLTLPQQVFAGLCYKGLGPLILETGVRWEDWSSFNKLQIKLDNGYPIPAEAKNWKSTFAYNIGAKYRLNDMVSLLAGYLYGDNPIPDSTFEPAIPDADTHLFSIGTDLSFQSVKVAVSYAYQLLEGRERAAAGGLSAGKFSSDLHMVAASLTYRF